MAALGRVERQLGVETGRMNFQRPNFSTARNYEVEFGKSGRASGVIARSNLLPIFLLAISKSYCV